MKHFIFSAFLLFFALNLSSASAETSKSFETGKVRYSAPSPWEETQVTSSMRQAQFRIPKAEGDLEDAEMAVFYFGSGQGGAVDANVARWAGQFHAADKGGPVAPDVGKTAVNGLKVTTVKIEGTYMGGMGFGNQEPKADFALLGAIVEGPEGPVFFKLTGPKKTVENTAGQFQALIESFSLQF
ncbi:MAG: hypothetical protein HY714_05240 [Candidatus Omnitrophica bacterium]|nr:hypothetical protein [Candidatus Omnitrophota bacterium]